MTSQEEFEQQVLNWISEWYEGPKERLSSQTSINVDLGVDGDDADELIQYLHERSGVIFSDFPFDRYFGPEVSIVAALVRPLLFMRRKNLEALSVRDLASYMYERRPKSASTR